MANHLDERLSDNTHIKRCTQCEKCVFWGIGTAFENAYDKVCCTMFPYPDKKPREVIDNTGKCEYRLTK